MADALIPEPNIPAPVSNVFSAPTPEAPAPAALTPEELAAFQTSEKEAGVVNPVRDFSAQELADFAIQDPGFNIAETFRNSPDLHGDQALVQKAADALDLVKERGFKLKDLPTAKQAGHAVLETAKGFGKQVWNYANAAGAAVQSAIADVFGAPGIAEESANEVNRRLAANVAGTEEAMTGLSELGQRAVGKAARLIGGPRTPEQKVADLWSDVGRAEVQQQRLTGQGPFALAVTGGESAKAGLKPEEVSTLAAGDPFSFYLFGSAAKGVGALVPKGVSTAVAAGTQAATEAAGRAAQIVSGKVLQGAGKAAGGAAGLVEGAAPIVAPIAGAIKGGGLYGPAGVAGGFLAGERAGRILARGARRAGAAAESLETVGREIASSAPVTSTYAQAGRDFLQALPGATFETAKGAALDLGLAAASAETPQETQGAAAFGTVLGGLHGAAKIGGRVISGQLIAPREYGISTPQPSSKKFAGLDALHNEAFANAEPGVKARLNAMRQFATGTSGADVFYAPEPAKLAAALESTGLSSETAKVWSEQNGFFTAELRDSSGQPRRVLVVTTPDSAPHEALHAIQDVVGEQGNQAIDKIVKDTYAGQWYEMGQDYANRIGVEPGATWQETILDKTGKGMTEAKEKVYRNVYNTLEGQQGAAPSRALVEQLAKEAYGRITDAALEKNPHISPEEVAQHAWREILSPAEAAEAADTYMAREIAADNFDAIFKHTGPSLGEPNSLPSKLARIAGRVIAAFGGEPLAGRTGGAARTPLATPVVEAVRRQAAGLKPEVTVPAPAGRVPIGKAPTGEGDKARKIAEAASDVPTEKGLRSPKELLGDVAAGIEGGNVIKLNYSSAPGPVAADLLSNRTLRRQLIADFNDVPEAQRQLVEKTFTPISLRQTKGGEVQVFGWSPEVFAANAHKMGKFLESRPDLAPLSPYALDATAHSFTPEGWQELYSDVKTVSENHKNGYTGSGESLVVPPEVTAKGKYFAPEVRGTAIPLDQTKADFINMLFNSKLPETALARSEQPLNLAGQRISEATLPGRVTVPVEPVGTFRGKAAERGGITGESVMEVNPVRRSIEAVAGADMPSLIEVNQQLNLSRIKEVEHTPEQQPVTANTLTLQAGFEPGQLIGGRFEPKEAGDMETIRAAAIKWRPTGELFTGFMHSMALDQAFERGVMPGIKSFDDLSQIQREQVGADKQWDSGFFTSKDRFVSRAEAEKIGEAAGQLRAGHVEGERLDSDKVNMVAQFEPKAAMEQVKNLADEQWRDMTTAYQGGNGNGLTGFAYDAGAKATTAADLQTFRSTADLMNEAGKAAMGAGQFDKAMSYLTRAQAAGEAYEAATGTKIDGSAKDVAKFIREHYNPSFEYPMPAAQFEPGEKKAAQTGLEFKKFFSDVTKGTFGKSEKPFVPDLDLSAAQDFITAKTEHSGNFDDHISKSIPTFYDAQVRKGNAILETYPDGARVLDIAASEGSFDKALSQLSDGKIETISLDPNPDMAKFFAEKSQVPGASYVEEAFLNGFEDNGKTIPAYNPTEKFDVVNESMGFQFIDPDRGAQIAEAKRMLNPDGVFLTEEKVRNPEWAANEKTKDTQHKNKYFTPVELKAKDEKVGFSQSKQETKAVGMVDNMAQQADLEQILKDNFKHVVQYWDSGNFKGYAASDNAAAVNRLVENMGDLNSKFSTVETPREVSGAEEFEFQNRQGQFEPKPKKKDDLKFKPGASGFSKAWILPNGTPVQLGGTWHHQWLSENPDVAKKYGLTVPKFTGGDAEGVREDALKKGFARVNYNQNTGEVTVEARAKDWRKQRDVVQDMIERNLDNVDRMTVNLMDANAQKMVDTDTKTLFNLDTDAEKMANLPFISTGEIRGGQFEPGEYWVGKGKINRAEEGHYEWASEKFGMRGHTAAYKAAEDAGYLRTVVGYGNDPIYVDPTGKFKAWEDIPKGDRNNIEDMAFEHNKPVRFGNAEVIEKPRPDEPSAQFEPKPSPEKETEFEKLQAAKREEATGEGYFTSGEQDRLEALVAERGAPENFQESYNSKPERVAKPEGLKPIAAGDPGFTFQSAWVMPSGEGYVVPSKQGREYHSDSIQAFTEFYENHKDDPSIVDSFQQGTGAMRVSVMNSPREIFENGGGIGVSVSRKPSDGQLSYLKDMFSEKTESGQPSVSSVGVDITDASGKVIASKFFSIYGKKNHGEVLRFLRNPFPEETKAAQFEPKREDETLFGAGAVEYPGNAAVANMTKAELADRFPEVVIPKRRDDPIPSAIVESPLFKQAGSEAKAVDAFADKLVEFAKDNEADPAFKAGAEWYSEFVPKLKKEFGKDAQVMAELLAATSPQTNVSSNFGYAFDALQSLKSGRFDKTIVKFKQGLDMMENGKWLAWYNKENAAGNIPKPPAQPTLPAFLEAWIAKYDLKPRQSNGALYGTHSIPVLQVFARKWLTESRGPKTLNFVKNLVGTSNESTIDLWADRTMRRVGYSGFKERWRILPGNVQGVSDADFSFSQKAFRKAAEQLDMKPDALQGALWFAEKKLWHDKGWGRLDLGDFQTELKKIPALKQAYGQRLAATKQRAKEVAVETPDLFAVEPRNLRK